VTARAVTKGSTEDGRRTRGNLPAIAEDRNAAVVDLTVALVTFLWKSERGSDK
jgi:hypothetical protein